MPNRDYIIKDGRVIKDEWQWLASDDSNNNAAVPEGKAILTLAHYLAVKGQLESTANIGVCLPNDCELSNIAKEIIGLPLIAIDFPVFMDGRGFSLARLLRERYEYKGEIRATGHVIRDQLCYMRRCGFNEFSIVDDDVDLEKAVTSLSDFSDGYQTSVDIVEPVFRRRAG